MASILAQNPNARVYPISSSAHQGIKELLRELKNATKQEKIQITTEEKQEDLPVISLGDNVLKDAWQVSQREDGVFVVTGEKIEKFARRTDLNNYASVNRLRDIMKKLGIKAELTSLGAEPESIISIAGKEFTLVEDY